MSNKIEFDNGSVIEAIETKDNVRGKRAECKPFYDWSDLQLMNIDWDEVLKDYVNKKEMIL